MLRDRTGGCLHLDIVILEVSRGQGLDGGLSASRYCYLGGIIYQTV